MSLIKALLLLILAINLFANTPLKHNYYINNDTIFLSDIVKNPKNDPILFKISPERHSKRVKSKMLIQELQNLGFKDYSSKYSYIQFNKKSPINTAKIRLIIKNKFLQKYNNNINITAISVTPRTYLAQMPQEYEIVLNKRYYLNRQGTLYIKTVDKKKIFFNFTIDAIISVWSAKYEIQKSDEISWVNIKKDSIMLEKFRAMPLNKILPSTYEARHRIKEGSILTQRDVVGLHLIKRGSNVNVLIRDSNIAISFTAKANQNGRYGDTITVINKNGKKIKVLVTGKNIAEIK